MILAGDIGGTNTRLALFRADAAVRAGFHPAPVAERTYPSRNYSGLNEIVGAFIQETGQRPEKACFGIAGPIRDQRCEATNLAWVIDARELGRELKIAQVALLNDLEANAYGIAVLGAGDLLTLREGLPGSQGNAALISAGTGLGEAGLFWDGKEHRPFACEGGHASFAPTDELQMELLRYLLRRYPHVSWERILSGPGLVNIYQFFRDTGRGEEPDWLAAEMSQSDPAATISRMAMSGKSALCEKALDLFVSLYGAEAGNAGLKFMARGGVYIGGGIAPKILSKLQSGLFLDAFLAKGRMKVLLEEMPLRVILNDRAALLGAARRAVTE